jgi:phage-Barnase-EndoU-ColicinE5/D-RelE like nuclease3
LEKVRELNNMVISTLNLSLDPNIPIYYTETNIEHMRKKHPEDFNKYSNQIATILEHPDYVAKHPKHDSIEYIKKYYDSKEETYVLVAVRASRKGILFARTLFVMNKEKVKNYQMKGALKEIKKL